MVSVGFGGFCVDLVGCRGFLVVLGICLTFSDFVGWYSIGFLRVLGVWASSLVLVCFLGVFLVGFALDDVLMCFDVFGLRVWGVLVCLGFGFAPGI